jgi:hypothetical protein
MQAYDAGVKRVERLFTGCGKKGRNLVTVEWWKYFI